MRERISTRITPQDKIIRTNNRFGNPGIKKQQGSTVEVYDSVLLQNDELSYDFFINAQDHQFPFTNLKKGQLQPQESFAMEHLYFALVEQSTINGDFLNITRLDGSFEAGISMGEFDFQIENQRVLKPIPMRSVLPQFNKSAIGFEQTNFEFETQIVIPPLLEFKMTCKFPKLFFAELDGIDTYLVATIGGAGGIFAPKSNY